MSQGRHKSYPEYKESGLEWLGTIPSNWTLNHVKHVAPFQVGWTPPTKTDANFDGDNLWANISDLTDKVIYDTAKRVSDNAVKAASMSITPKGSLLYSFKLSVGTVSFAGKDMFTNEAIASFLEHAKLPLGYLFYALPEFVIKNASTNIYGANILNQELIRDAHLLVPSFSEAEQIAKFLDHETAKIDRLIEKQEELIRLLKEKRQAVISHAVTKGLNPHAPLKDSGIEWLGQVPAHWVVGRYKFCTTRVVVGIAEAATHAYAETGTPIIRSTNITEEGLREEGILYIKPWFAEQNGSKYLYAGDVVTVRTGYPGISATVPESLHRSQCFTNLVATPSKDADPDFLTSFLNSHFGKEYFDLTGWGSAQKNISVPILQNIPIAWPPLDEQREIVTFVLKQRGKYTTLISSAENAVTLLQERRTALISAAVTGKIDVRHWQPPAGSN